MSDENILTTPPVHEAGPDIGQREVEGGEVARVGLDSQLSDAFKQIANDMAARNTRVAIAVPVRQLVNATIKIVEGLPRVPDYDAVSAHLVRWTEESEYSPTDIPDADPDSLGVFVRDRGSDIGKVCVELTTPRSDATHTFDFEDPIYAKSFFLAGLAACEFAEAQKSGPSKFDAPSS